VYKSDSFVIQGFIYQIYGVLSQKKVKIEKIRRGEGGVGCERRLECVGCAAETKRVLIGLKRGFD